jgi:RNase P/RNase MRP subunit POP5
MIENKRYFTFHIIPKDNSKQGFVDKVLANSFKDAQDSMSLRYLNKQVRIVYQGIDGR